MKKRFVSFLLSGVMIAASINPIYANSNPAPSQNTVVAPPIQTESNDATVTESVTDSTSTTTTESTTETTTSTTTSTTTTQETTQTTTQKTALSFIDTSDDNFLNSNSLVSEDTDEAVSQSIDEAPATNDAEEITELETATEAEEQISEETSIEEQSNEECSTEIGTEESQVTTEQDTEVTTDEATTEIISQTSNDDATESTTIDAESTESTTAIDATETTTDMIFSADLSVEDMKSSTNGTQYGVTGGYVYFNTILKAIVGCTSSVTEAIIPSTINGITVERITSSAFSNASSLRKLTLPDKIEIADNAFSGISSLTLYVGRGSTGEAYAKRYGMTYYYTDGSVSSIPDTIEGWLFDADYYRTHNADVVNAVGSDSLRLYTHWINNGIAEGRDGSYVFNARYYLDHNLDLRNMYGYNYKAAYNHFISSGCNEFRPSSATYDGASYRKRYTNLASYSGVNLLHYYVKTGRLAGQNATPIVDTEAIPDNLEGWIYDNNVYIANNQDVVTALGTTDASKLYYHWKHNGIAEGRKASYVFDAKYYLEKNPELVPVIGNNYTAAYNHFINFGCNELRPSSSEYDGAAYKARYNDIASLNGQQLLKHYVKNGKAEGRNAATGDTPTPDVNIPDNIEGWIFDPAVYAQNNQDIVNALGADPKVLYNHWKNSGIKEGRIGSRLFNAQYYAQNNQDIVGSIGVTNYLGLYNHFISSGCSEMRKSSEEFDPIAYRNRYADLAALDGPHLLEHFAKYGRAEGRIATTKEPVYDIPDNIEGWIFDPAVYAQNNQDIVNLVGSDPKVLYTHWKNAGIAEGRICSHVYNAQYYAQNNQDISNSIGTTNYTGLYNHFIDSGCFEMRKSSEEFDPIAYRNRYNDLARFNGPQLLEQFVKFGRAEGRNAATAEIIPEIPDNIEGWIFSVDYYKQNNPDIVQILGTEPKILYNHWKTAGIAEGRKASFVLDLDFYAAMNQDISLDIGLKNYVGLYNHFVNSGCSEFRDSSPLFCGYAYKNRYDDLSNMDGHQLLYQYTHSGINEGRNASDHEIQSDITYTDTLFDPQYYIINNPDIAEIIGTDVTALYNHWINYGVKEGRTASPVYNPNEYLAINPELNNAIFKGYDYAGLYNHFYNYGRNEGRQASSLFNLDDYKALNQDLIQAFGNNNAQYYWHYVWFGKNEGRKAII